MPDGTGTLEQLALALGRVLAPLEAKLESGNVLELLADLGIELPPELLAQPGFADAVRTGSAAAARLPPEIADLITAIDNRPDRLRRGPPAVAPSQPNLWFQR